MIRFVDSLLIVAPIVGVLWLIHVLLCSALCPFYFFAIILIGSKRESWLLYFVCLPGVL